MVIHQLPEFDQELQMWGQRLGVPWCGEGMPTFTQKVFLELLKRKRQRPTGAPGTCVECGAPATAMDHIVPLRSTIGSAPQEMQPLCKDCHDAKTSSEQGDRTLESHFCETAWRFCCADAQITTTCLAAAPPGNPRGIDGGRDQT
jgi:hypothetical protein